jgi:TonB family protein
MRAIKSITASILIHLFIFMSCYYGIIWWKNSSFSAIDIDLSGSTLMLRPANTKKKAVVPQVQAQDWYFNTGSKLAVATVKVTIAAAAEEPAAVQCPPPCPDIPSDWAASGNTSRRPVWSEGFITEDDYPKETRAQGKEGVVKVEIYIDATGVVRDARVIQSSDPRFTEVVMNKLKKAKFEPALDKAGRPIAVHMAIPIVFELH